MFTDAFFGTSSGTGGGSSIDTAAVEQIVDNKIAYISPLLSELERVTNLAVTDIWTHYDEQNLTDNRVDELYKVTGLIVKDANDNDIGNVTALTAKANKTYVDDELAKKANTTSLDAKADASTVTTLNTTVTNLNTTVGLKADKTYVDDELAKKANTTSLDAKADASTVTSLSTTVTTLNTTVADKADKTYVDEEFRTKVMEYNGGLSSTPHDRITTVTTALFDSLEAKADQATVTTDFASLSSQINSLSTQLATLSSVTFASYVVIPSTRIAGDDAATFFIPSLSSDFGKLIFVKDYTVKPTGSYTYNLLADQVKDVTTPFSMTFYNNSDEPLVINPVNHTDPSTSILHSISVISRYNYNIVSPKGGSCTLKYLNGDTTTSGSTKTHPVLLIGNLQATI